MPLSPGLARWLDSQGHDAAHVSSLKLDRASDVEILDRGAQEDRTIITADLDYPRLLALAAATGPSLILFRGGNWSETDVIARMNQILNGFGEIDICNSILVVDRNRVRRRRLPIK